MFCERLPLAVLFVLAKKSCAMVTLLRVIAPGLALLRGDGTLLNS